MDSCLTREADHPSKALDDSAVLAFLRLRLGVANVHLATDKHAVQQIAASFEGPYRS